MTASESSLVLLETLSPSVSRLTLNSPGDRNALSAAMRNAILDALQEAKENGAKVAIISGDDRAFSSGYKLDPGVMRPSTAIEDRHRLIQVTDFMRAYREQPLVTIAEVRGYCLAGGTDLLLASDLAFTANDAQLGVPNVRGVGVTLLLPLWSWVLGPQRAKLLTLTGDLMTGSEAAEFGFVVGAYDKSELAERVEAVANRMARMPAELLAVTKHTLNVAWDSAGLSNAVLRGAELDALSHATRPVMEFWDNVVANGMRSALADRDRDFTNDRILDLL